MIIDFHTHVFPPKIARHAMESLTEIMKMKPGTDGTADGLAASMEEASIDISVVLPAVTDPHQYHSVTRYAASLNEEFHRHPDRGILSFAGLHPECPNLEEKVKELKSLGFLGLKLHPDYQHTFFNDIRYKRIIYKASELGLIVVTHSGVDIYSPDKVHCTVPMIDEVLREVAPEKLVLAHMGCHLFYDDVKKYLAGRNVYFDTAYVMGTMNPGNLRELMLLHGTDKILFATDSPWNVQKTDVQFFEEMEFTKEESDCILYKNAARLLDLPLS